MSGRVWSARLRLLNVGVMQEKKYRLSVYLLISLFTDGDWNFYWYVCCSAPSQPAALPSIARYFVPYLFVLQVMRRKRQGGGRAGGEGREENEKAIGGV